MNDTSLNNYKKIFKFKTASSLKLDMRESGTLEFKESFNWNSKDKYCKSMVAFSNKGGGSIIFGIKDNPRELVGLQSNNFEDFDESHITQYLNSLFSPEVDFEKFVLDIRGKKTGIIHVSGSAQKPVIAIKNDGDIKEGEIYYRYNARSEKIKFPELKSLINQIKEKERKNWMELFEKISRIGPENTALMDIARGKIEGRTETLIIDHKLIPKLKFIQEGNFRKRGMPVLKLIGEVRPVSVIGGRKNLKTTSIRITDDPSAPAMRINEDELLKEFSLDYHSLTRELSKRYADFKTNENYHKIRKELMAKNFSVTRRLNPKNPKSSKQDFYSPKIFKEFDKHYSKKKR